MGNRILKKGQASLEASVAFVVAILLLATIVKIWFWANNQIVERQIKFNETRVAAGTSSDWYKLDDKEYGHPWPVYTPPALTEEP